VAALAAAVLGTFLEVRDLLLGAAIGAVAVQAMLRMPDQGPHGLPSLIAAVAVLPLLWSAYDRSPRRVRRRTRRLVFVGVLLGVLGSGAFAVAAVLAQKDLAEAVDEARDGLEMIREGEQERGAELLARAAGSFEDADRLLNAFWVEPAAVLPVIGDHREALGVAAASGKVVTTSGAIAASTAPYQELKASDGKLDLAVTRSFQQPVAEATAALRAARDDLAEAGSDWLVPPVADALDEFLAEVTDALPEAELATEALRIVPHLLGADGDTRYLVLFTNPAEARFLGGFAGSYGVITAKDGQTDFTVSGRISELLPPSFEERTLEGPEEYLVRYSRFSPARYFQNLTVSPDMPTDARVTRALYEEGTGEELDGVIVVDPYALAALLTLTGPVEVEGLAEPLTAENAANFLLFEQYVDYGEDRDDRKDRLEAAGRATFDALTSRDLPGPRAVADALAPVVEQRRLLFFPFSEDAQPFFDDIGTTGAFAPDLDGDFVSLRVANANPSKIDSFLNRSLDYQVDYDPSTGAVTATATVVLQNRAPAGGLPPYVIGNDRHEPVGSNTTYLSFYSPLGLLSATLDGEPVGMEPQRELGASVYSRLLTVPPGGSVTLVLQLQGTLPVAGDYHLDVLHQPLVLDEKLAVDVRAPAGWRAMPSEAYDVADGGAHAEQAIRQDHHLDVVFGP
jgi:hypothetical protein